MLALIRTGIIVAFNLLAAIVTAQQQLADSVEKILHQPHLSDSAKANSLINLAMYYELVDRNKAHQFYQQARDFAASKKFNFFIAKAYRFEAWLDAQEVHYDKQIINLKKAVETFSKSNDSLSQKEAAFAYQDIAGYYRNINDYKNTIEYYLKSIRLLEVLHGNCTNAYLNVSMIYTDMNENENAKLYLDKALQYARKYGTPINKFTAYYMYSQYYTEKKDFITAKKYLDSSRLFYSANFDRDVIRTFNTLVGNSFKELHQYDSAIYYFTKAYNSAQEDNIHTGIYLQALLKIAYMYISQKKYKDAETLLLKTLEEAQKVNSLIDEKEANESLSELYEKTGDYKKAYQYHKHFFEIRDSLVGEDKKLFAQELEKKYETEKKEQQILFQQSIIKQKNILNYVLAGAALLLIIISLLSFRNYKNKQKLQQQRISELEKEKQLTATELILQGEEKERARLAKDLHDGLSGMLSGVKFSLQNMQGYLVLTPDNQQSFERSLDMLDSSINEIRRVAHNMMPEALVRYGLDTALKDLCTEINKSDIIKIVYQSMGMENVAIEQTRSVVIYRIIQELINNTIKHAAATEMLVQVLRENTKLIINIEDNGKGFDANYLSDSKGMGWTNIRSRIEYLKATLNLQTALNKGTSVNIEMNIA